MSQLHQEALRRQRLIDSRRSKKQEVSNSTQNDSSQQQSNHNPYCRSPQGGNTYMCNLGSTPSHMPHGASYGMHGSSGRSSTGSVSSSDRSMREREVVDHYLQNLKKETKGRVQYRSSSTDYLMQW